MNENPSFVIGISGISGAGKSTLTKRLAKTLNATALFWDDFDEISQGPEDYVHWFETSHNYDDWIYDDLAATLKVLKRGQTIVCPATKKELIPTPYILFDAPLGYCHHATGQHIDFLICLDTPPDIALARRLLRDYRSQDNLQRVLNELEGYLLKSRPLFLLAPEEKECDLMIDGSLSLDEQEARALKFLCS
ncbi:MULTISPECIES: AAA family ATPase [Parachlamydia]|uniref:AAA family ATPase n=1 Tax=Parachlamydia TaxID=83551 RepID=UPI0001C17574|nr:AAA family ATPase [Parachlamydia acanthamoebae]EFB40715.1 hypothetical protein pah_c197o112 [Parachlamydia acanthamoebae str. Hall's coccus]